MSPPVSPLAEPTHARPRRVVVATLGVALALVCSACGGGDRRAGDAPSDRADPSSSRVGATSGDGEVTPPGPPSSPSTTAATTTTARPPTGSGQPVTIAFAGDATFEGLDARLAASPDTLLAAIAPVLGAADLTMVNLEAALATGGVPEEKAFTFRVPPVALDALGAAGVDVVSMANNHGMDFGPGGLQESLATRAGAEVAVIGIGADAADAYSPFVAEVRGQRIGFIAANDVFDAHLVGSWTATDDSPGIASAKPPWQERLLAAVRELRTRVDTLAVFLHFGTEKHTCPTARQQELVGALADAGADIVVGSHPHRLQGMGYRGDRFVAYSLSNFVFRSPSAAGRSTGVLTVTATGRRIDSHTWTPARIDDLVPVPSVGDDAVAGTAAMEELRGCTGLTGAPIATGGT